MWLCTTNPRHTVKVSEVAEVVVAADADADTEAPKATYATNATKTGSKAT